MFSSYASTKDADVDTFTSGDAAALRGLLLKLFNDGKTKLDLDDE